MMRLQLLGDPDLMSQLQQVNIPFTSNASHRLLTESERHNPSSRKRPSQTLPASLSYFARHATGRTTWRWSVYAKLKP